MIFDALKRQLGETLGKGGIDTPFLDAKILIQHAAGWSQSDLILRGEEAVPLKMQQHVFDLAARRLSGEPIDHILGRAAFYGRVFEISKDVLSPRPETEGLIDAALSRLEHLKAPNLLDLGTGSGAILITLLCERDDAGGTGIDISAGALAIARKNAAAHNMAGRAKFLQGSWFEPAAGTFDLIMSNPPYITDAAMDSLPIEVKSYDPDIALRGGADGLDPYRHIIPRAPDYLKPGGWLLFEIGFDQGAQAADMLRRAGYQQVEILPDLAGLDRMALGKK